MPDGARVVFGSTRGGGERNLYSKAADGTGETERLTTSEVVQLPMGVSRDGARLVFGGQGRLGMVSLPSKMVESLTGESSPEGRFGHPSLSPDGQWIAYGSDETGEMEVYVESFPNLGEARLQVSRGGGRWPVWAPDDG